MRRPPEAPTRDEILETADNWLPGTLSDSRYIEAAQEVNTKYRHWAKVRFIARSKGLDPHRLWALVKMIRGLTQRSLPLRGAMSKPVVYCVPDFVQDELMRIDQQLSGRFGAPEDEPVSAHDRERYIVSALREEAIASSMLEGAATTRREAKRMLGSGRKPRTRGERMVYNNYRAISFVREHRGTPLSVDFLLEVQRIITEGTLESESESGRLRGVGDRIVVEDAYGEVVHEPPPASELSARLDELCRFGNGECGPEFLHPVVRACVLHYQLGFDHPFCDGNGRTARAIFYWQMLRSGYWLFEYLPISRLIYAGPAKYGLAFLYTETDSFDATYFLVYKARILRRAREELHEYIGRKQREVAAARGVFEGDSRLNHRQREVILRLVRGRDGWINIQIHKDRTGVAYGTARSDLLDLAEWGYLLKRKQGKGFVFVPGPSFPGDNSVSVGPLAEEHADEREEDDDAEHGAGEDEDGGVWE